MGDKQHKKEKSCTTNFLSFLEDIFAGMDTGHSADVIFLEFKKTFD